MFIFALVAALLFCVVLVLTIIRALHKDISSPNAEMLSDLMSNL